MFFFIKNTNYNNQVKEYIYKIIYIYKIVILPYKRSRKIILTLSDHLTIRHCIKKGLALD